MTLDELHSRFPGIHALFVDSPEFTPPTAGNISGELVRFLWARGFKVATSHTPPPSKRSHKRVNYGGILIIHGSTLNMGGPLFTSYDEALDHALDHALDIFEQELKINA